MRSSSEWKVTTTSRPPGFSALLGCKQRLRQFAELVVDEDAQRLEHARGGMDLVLGLARRHDLDQASEIARRLERLFGTTLFDGMRDARRLLLFAEKDEDADEIGNLGAIDDVGGRDAACRHPHVERAVLLKGKSALRLVDLHRRDADIEDDAIKPLLRRMIGKARKTGNG